ncbi:MAG: prepilin peptidase [Deltaproteobacteria bacterium]|nr:prepilin peptidase [Deltaproteobacteria bacterium]
MIFSSFQWLFYFAFFFFGLLVGSFLNVCIVRIPLSESIVWPASHCRNCKRPIAFYENIPVLSFLFLKGRCRTCDSSISWLYPLIEIFSGILAILCFYHLQNPSLALLWFLFFVSPLLVMAVIDAKTFSIYNVISFPFIIVGVLLRWFTETHGTLSLFPASLWFSLKGIFCGAGILTFILIAYERLRKQKGLGWGDVTLAAGLGAFFGAKSILVIFILASWLGVFYGLILMFFQNYRLNSKIPFGPFLALAAFLRFIFPVFHFKGLHF